MIGLEGIFYASTRKYSCICGALQKTLFGFVHLIPIFGSMHTFDLWCIYWFSSCDKANSSAEGIKDGVGRVDTNIWIKLHYSTGVLGAIRLS